jgi:TBC1 domain family member 5
LREEILRDVERCLPDRPYFRQPHVQQQLLDILFVWCKLNPDIGYRQGMHELLAPILWVVDEDSVDKDGKGGDLADLLDHEYIEHDSFTMFSTLMQTAKSFYEPASKSDDGEDSDSPMVTRSKHIFYTLLPDADPELAAHLQDIEILPQIFLM